MSDMIHAENLTFRYPDFSRATHLALDGVNLTIPYGQFTAILGRNGSGKSTFARMCNAINLPSGGRIWVDGMDTMDEEQLWDIRRACSMVFQNPDNQIVATVVEEDAAFGPENMGVEPKEIRSRVYQALKMVGMYDYHLHAPHLLSGGQKQRVAIAGVLAMKPKCIVLDEPTAMLDPQGRADIMRILHELHEKQHITIILITHHMDEAVQADRDVVMDDGQIKLDDTPRNVFAKVDEIKALGLDVPQSTELVYRLGIKCENTVLNANECVDLFKKTLEAKR